MRARLPLSGFLTLLFLSITMVLSGCGGSSASSMAADNPSGAKKAPTVTVQAGSPTITNGMPNTLKWTTTNATSVTITPSPDIDDVTTLPLNYATPIAPMQTTTYTVTATGPGGTTSASTTVRVNQVAPTVALMLSPTTMQAGESATLSWTADHATGLKIVDDKNNAIPVQNPSLGAVTVTPTETTTYRAMVTGFADVQGRVAPTNSSTATLTISSLKASLAADTASLAAPGQSTTLAYNVTPEPGQKVTVSINNGALDASTSPNGKIEVKPSETTTYELTATQSNGVTTTARATVAVGTTITTNIKHIFFLVQENRNFDNYFSKLGVYRASDPFTGKSYGAVTDVDGIANDAAPQYTIKDHLGNPLHPFHAKTVCIDDISPAWDEAHVDVDLQGSSYKMDGFANKTAAAQATGTNDPAARRVDGYYTWTDLPYYYELATQYATSDRWFQPELANTVPNRMYLFAATSYGTTYPGVPAPGAFDRPVIFDTLAKDHITWNYVTQDGTAFLGYYDNSSNPNWSKDGLGSHYKTISSLMTTLSQSNADTELPSVIFIEKGGSSKGMDEHPGDGNLQYGAANTANIINAFIHSTVYADSIFILTWDDPGGFYDHVPPHPMPAPDSVPPNLKSPDGGKTGVIPGNFKTTGIRLPVIVVSPWVKPHFVSHLTRDYTAILKLIEYRFGLPALTGRDAGQDDMLEFFNFTTPSILTPPKLPTQPTTGVCNAALESGS